MNKNSLIAIASGLALTGVIVWRIFAAHVSVVHIVDVHDISRSHFQGCQVFGDLAQDAASTAGLSSESTLTILVTGDKATANEPIKIAQYDSLKSSRAVEGKNAYTKRLHDMLQDVELKCTALKPTDRSPILLAVRQGLAVLHSEGCRRNSQCVLNVDTDGQENADKWLQKALNSPNANQTTALSKLDNDGIRVRFCGTASTAGQLLDAESREVRNITRDFGGDERLRLAWTGLFANPGQVLLEPFCINGASLPQRSLR